MLGHDDICNMIARSILLLILTVVAGCSKDNGTDEGAKEAIRAFASFQAALQANEREICRDLLTIDSQEALQDLPWEAIASQQPLKVVSAERPHDDQPLYLVNIRDPNNGNSKGQFIVVREYGRMVVDLIASAGLTAEIVDATGSKQQFEPKRLSPRDRERARLHQLSQPPR